LRSGILWNSEGAGEYAPYVMAAFPARVSEVGMRVQARGGAQSLQGA